METEGINTSKHRHIQKFQETDDEVIISFKKAHDEQEQDEEIMTLFYSWRTPEKGFIGLNLVD